MFKKKEKIFFKLSMNKKNKNFKEPTTVLDVSENKLLVLITTKKEMKKTTSINLSSVDSSMETKPQNQCENKKPLRFCNFSVVKTKSMLEIQRKRDLS